jgi:hypothetical protein
MITLLVEAWYVIKNKMIGSIMVESMEDENVGKCRELFFQEKMIC